MSEYSKYYIFQKYIGTKAMNNTPRHWESTNVFKAIKFKDCSVDCGCTSDVVVSKFYDIFGRSYDASGDTINKDYMSNVKDHLRYYEINRIELSEGIKSIYARSFSGTVITELNIPSSVVFIDNDILGDCKTVSSLTVDSNNPIYHSDGNCIMEDGKVLIGCATSIIPLTATSIESNAFFNKYMNLTSLTIPSTVTRIKENAIYSIYLSSITFNNPPAILETHSIYSCECVTLDLGNALIGIEQYAISTMPNLTSITIPSSVISLKSGAISSCSKLTNVIFTGTKNQYMNITGGVSILDNCGTKIIHCSDGDIRFL